MELYRFRNNGVLQELFVVERLLFMCVFFTGLSVFARIFACVSWICFVSKRFLWQLFVRNSDAAVFSKTQGRWRHDAWIAHNLDNCQLHGKMP